MKYNQKDKTRMMLGKIKRQLGMKLADTNANMVEIYFMKIYRNIKRIIK
jgi:hypothetical protein